MKRLAVIAAAGLWLAFSALPAVAVDASADEVRALAAAAADGDAPSLEALREVTSIDGVPVDLGRILEAPNADSRTEAIAAIPAREPDSPGALSETLNDILSHDRFKAGEPAVGTVAPDEIEDPSPGIDIFGIGWPWIAAGLVVAIVVFWLLLRSAPPAVVSSPSGSVRPEGDRASSEPASLEAQADAAERDGDYAEAVRLRFRAGVMRLEAAKIIRSRSLATSGAVRRAVPGPMTDEVTRAYDLVAYGGRSAERKDAAQAREGWRVLISQGRNLNG